MPAGVVCTPVSPCSDVHHVVYIYSTVHRQQQRTYIVYVHSTLHAVQYWSHVASEMAGSTPQHPCIPWSMVCASLYLCTYVGGVYTPLHCIIACTPQDVVQVCIYTTAGMLCRSTSTNHRIPGSQDARIGGMAYLIPGGRADVVMYTTTLLHTILVLYRGSSRGHT